MANNAKAANDDAAEPPWHLPCDIEEIRKHNPRLDDEQAHRAFLPSAPQLDARQWDTLVDSLTKATTTTVSGNPFPFHRASQEGVLSVSRLNSLNQIFRVIKSA